MPYRPGHCARVRNSSGHAGFSLVEVIIAMFVLALMALAFLPVLVGAMRTNSTNSDIVSATSLANALLTDARQAGEIGCSTLAGWEENPTPTASGFDAEVTVDEVAADPAQCPPSRPAAVKVAVRVYPTGEDGSTLIELSTKVMVENP